MKFSHIGIVIFAILFTTPSKAQEGEAVPAQDATGRSITDIRTDKFNQVIDAFKIRTLPVLDNTNFDSFIEAEDYNDVDVKALNLESIYPNLYMEGYSYRAITSYRVKVSEAFHSVVVTLRKGDNEMESVCINYDFDGHILDSKVIAYDEIAESWSRIESKIEADKLTVNHIKWMDDKQVETVIYRIEADGRFTQLSQDDIRMDHVIQQLGIEDSRVNRRFVVTKVMPNNSDDTIMVIPEFVEGNEDEEVFELRSHILIVHTSTGQITHRYAEMGWTSDAVQLSEVSIDTARYQVSEETRAFGIKVHYYVNSKGSPYANTTMALFIKSGDSLKKLLDHYDVMEYSGEWDGYCYGAFRDLKNTFIMSEEKTNGYFDIIVKHKITDTKNQQTDTDDCESTETVSESKSTLTFDGKTYH